MKSPGTDASRGAMLSSLRKAVGRLLHARWPRGAQLLHRFQRHGRRGQGLPDGLDESVLNPLVIQHIGAPPVRVSHQLLSGWKAAGTYRLFLQTRDGAQWTLIFKNEVYDYTRIPALRNLPFQPGPPEYAIYSTAEGPLASYLPAAYLCEEIAPGRHYRYLLQDLHPKYRAPNGLEDKMRIVAALPALHQALRTDRPEARDGALLRYRDGSVEMLQDYFRRNLKQYARDRSDGSLTELLARWSTVERLYCKGPDFDPQAVGPIHGDPNPSNVHLHEENPEHLKFVDWEWAGLHLPHADLVSVSKGMSPEHERQAVALFAERLGTGTMAEHWRPYLWCKLERGLLDASFLALIELDAPPTTRLNLPNKIGGAAQRILAVIDELSS